MKTVLLFLTFLSFSFQLGAQECPCTIQEVETNTVEPSDLVVGDIIQVATTSELRSAISTANQSGGNLTILIEDGTYQIASTASYPYITASNVVFRSVSGNRDAVILTGTGMISQTGTEIGISAVGDNITIADLTIRGVSNHGISVSGDNLFVHNVKIQDAFEQLLKGTSGGGGAEKGTVQCSLFEYTAGVGPQYYIGGLDIHDGDDWTVRDNVFKNIASPSMRLAEHAIHFWNNSSNAIVERNHIYNCDRGIGFGLGSSGNTGGIIRNNMIYNDGHHDFDDVGIGLETSPDTRVYNNSIYIDYPNAIEYRFEATTGVEIVNNITNKRITSRNGGEADVRSNLETVSDDWFVDLEAGDLRLAGMVTSLVDQGEDLGDELMYDIDKKLRSDYGTIDMGAQEFGAISTHTNNQEVDFGLSIYPNPSIDFVRIEVAKKQLYNVQVLSADQKLVFASKSQSLDTGMSLSTTGWQSGIYFLSLENSSGAKEFFKFLVQR